ncbi:hypothetical protein K2173_011013 [Erythroxylum novogranatense]|uniref:RING-type E3 ubiquitin transferase n=1 Tax=Erythroxylum novogranatense TaxID=1862640 RepID=A0AAV8T0G7_9ROSI|nr:hypothetical protein K2173_011013 [Erythroxylum novogranatense]
MWHQKGYGPKKGGGNGLVAVAIDRDKGSQHALKWAIETFLTRGQTIILIHVVRKPSASSANQGVSTEYGSALKQQHDKQIKDLFLSFRCYCTRKDVQCFEVILEDHDIVKALTEYTSYALFETLVLGSPSRHGFIRKFRTDVPSSVSKGAPDFCNVYVISKGKVSSARYASRPAPFTSPILEKIQEKENQDDDSSDIKSRHSMSMSIRDRSICKPRVSVDESFKSPFSRVGRGIITRSTMDFSESESDISFVSSGRPSTDRPSSVGFEYIDSGPRLSTSSGSSYGSIRSGPKFVDLSSQQDLSPFSYESGFSSSSQKTDELEAEMRRLKLELKQTMDMYSTACREALTAKQKAMELQRWRMEEERKMEEAKLSEEAAISLAEKEKARCKAAMEAAEAANKIAELESHRRYGVETKAFKDAQETKKVMGNLADIRYRKYSIEEIENATDSFSPSRKIGEGGYGPVFKCRLDHTPVAVKVLRPDAAQGREQFDREVEVLSLIRHPNMVLLLGACPEYGILVYEHMARGSLDDRLFRKGNSPPLPWQLRFRIAAEVATGLLFLHQTKPEPLVHRDLKPGNILLDSNYVSKISDVGLAKLVPALAENATQCHMTSTAGTFCYIDPEYQQTGMLGVKSDIYSLGIILLQILTAKPPMGLSPYVERAIKNGTFKEVLDPTVPDWPLEETLCIAKLGIQCAEMRRKDRPDLSKVVLPQLNRLRDFAEEKMNFFYFPNSASVSPTQSFVATTQVFLFLILIKFAIPYDFLSRFLMAKTRVT